MPEKQLQWLWVERIQERLAMELLINVHTGGWIVEFCLLGRTREELKPHIVVTCTAKDTKRQVEKVYKSLRWLRELMKQQQLRFITFHAMARLNAFGKLSPNSIRIARSTVCPTYCGSILEPPQGYLKGVYMNPFTHAQRVGCTLGGLILADDLVYAISAGHGFIDETDSPSGPPMSLEHHEFGRIAQRATDTEPDCLPQIFDETDEVVGITHSSPTYSRYPSEQVGSLSTRQTDPELFSVRSTATVSQISSRLKIPGRPSVGVASDPFSTHFLDWAIIQLRTQDQPYLPNQDIDGNFIEETIDVPEDMQKISVLIGGGQKLAGILYPPRVSLNLGIQVYNAYRIALQVCLSPGFSGAWVLLGDKVCGHLIAAREDVPWVCMQPIQPILQDIQKRLMAGNVRLLPRNHRSSMKAEDIEPNILTQSTRSPGNSRARTDQPPAHCSTPETAQHSGQRYRQGC